MAREEFRRRIQFPVPSIPEIEARLHEVLSPALLDPRQRSEPALHLRNRILTLPVMVAIVLSLVWRQLTSLGGVLRLLAQEGLLWTEAITVSQQALSKRLVTLPASLFETVFSEAIAAIQRTRQGQARPWPKELAPLRERFPALWVRRVYFGGALEAGGCPARPTGSPLGRQAVYAGGLGHPSANPLALPS